MREQIYYYRARASFAISSAERAVCKNIIFRCIYILIVYFEDTAQKKKPCESMASFFVILSAVVRQSARCLVRRDRGAALPTFSQKYLYIKAPPATARRCASLPRISRRSGDAAFSRATFSDAAPLWKSFISRLFSGARAPRLLSAFETSRLAIHILYDYIEYLAES